MFLGITLEGIASLGAFIIAIFALLNSRSQHKHSQQVIQAETLMHFTKVFHEIVETDKRIFAKKINDPVWISSYWGLQGSEFYFFHHGTIPAKMYAIWMTDVVDNYSNYPDSWETHKEYLKSYGTTYPEMRDFFIEIKKISDKKLEKFQKYKKVHDYVIDWIEENRSKLE